MDSHISCCVNLQGWRLDPLLLFCQLLTAGTAVGFAVESLKLRQAVQDIQARSLCLTRRQLLSGSAADSDPLSLDVLQSRYLQLSMSWAQA